MAFVNTGATGSNGMRSNRLQEAEPRSSAHGGGRGSQDRVPRARKSHHTLGFAAEFVKKLGAAHEAFWQTKFWAFS